MNYIEVNVGKGVSDARKTLTKEIAEWCLGELLPRVRTLDITIELLDKVDGGIDGAQWEGEDNRQHFIEINENQYYDDFVTAVMHEMVHVKQWVKGEMYEYANPNEVRWMKKKYDNTTVTKGGE